MWDQVLSEYGGEGVIIDQDIANNLLRCVGNAIQNQEDSFLRARGYICGGILVESQQSLLGEQVIGLLKQTIAASTQDHNAMVQISCIKILQRYITSLPREITAQYQREIIASIARYLSTLTDDDDGDEDQEALAVMVETLHSTLETNYAIALDPSINAIDLLFNMVSHGLGNLQVTGLVQDTIQAIAEDQYEHFLPICQKILPVVTTSIDNDDLSKENLLTEVRFILKK